MAWTAQTSEDAIGDAEWFGRKTGGDNYCKLRSSDFPMIPRPKPGT